jgi:hypothetical protein
MEEQK